MIIQITFVRRICGPTEVKNQLGGFHHSFNTLQDGQWMVLIQKEKIDISACLYVLIIVVAFAVGITL